MYTYEELLLAFNNLNKKLYIKNFFDKNMNNINKFDLYTVLLDFRFFNKHLTEKDNERIKINLAKKLNYSGKLIFGNKKDNMIYKYKEIDNNEIKEYYYYGFIKKDQDFIYKYKFKNSYYVKKIYWNNYLIFKLNYPYDDLFKKFAQKMINLKLYKYIDIINFNYEQSKIELTFFNSSVKMYVKNMILMQNMNIIEKERTLFVC